MRSERGQILPLVAFACLVLVGLAAFAIDVGHAYLVKHQLQNSVDSAALAGAYTSQSPATATTDAAAYAAANTPAGVSVTYGYDWPSPGVLRVTANAQTDTWFARVFGHDHFHVSAHAQAVLVQVGSNIGGRLVDDGYVIPVPLAKPVCTVQPVFTHNSTPPHVGTTESITLGTWSNNPTSYAYVWRRYDSLNRADGDPPFPNPGAVLTDTGPSRVVIARDINRQIRAHVVATNAAGSTSCLPAGETPQWGGLVLP